MRTFSLFIILATFAVLCVVNGDKPATLELATMAADSTENLCKERRCPRMYKPVCGSKDGVAFTISTRCEYNNEARCASLRLGVSVAPPVYRFLFNGPCVVEGGSEDAQKKVRPMPQIMDRRYRPRNKN